MTDREIVGLLQDTGHLEWPFGKQQPVPDEVWAIFDGALDSKLRYPAMIDGPVASYQDFLCECLDPLCMKHHSRPARHDGQLGPATMDLMELPRCGCPDYSPDVAAATGSGSWAGCHGIGEFHAATVYIDMDLMPPFLEPNWDEIWGRVVAAFEEIGLRFIRTTDKRGANIHFSFKRTLNGPIGLALVGRGQSCGSQVWCRFAATYKPSDLIRMWVILVMHELAHNASLRHTRGGIMNPVIVAGLAASWKGDPSLPVLERYYGGEPIPGGPDVAEYWIEQGMRSNRGREVWTRLSPPIPVEGK